MFDPSLFGSVLRARLIRLGLTYRTAAKEIGTSCATLNRVARGHEPDVENYLRIAHWLTDDGLDPVWLSNRKDGASPQIQGPSND